MVFEPIEESIGISLAGQDFYILIIRGQELEFSHLSMHVMSLEGFFLFSLFVSTL